jgi:opacity protein-like surface antigen
MKMQTLLLVTAFACSNAFADASGPIKHTYDVVLIHKKDNQYKNYYSKIEIGAAVPKFKKSFTGGVGGGYKFNEYIRSDLMLDYKQAKIKKSYSSKSNTYAAMLNAYFDANNDTIATPYLTAGIGVGHITTKVKPSTGTGHGKIKKNNFLWNVGIGCQFKLQDDLKFDLGYRYTDLGSLGSKTISGKKIKLRGLHTNEILAGLVYAF